MNGFSHQVQSDIGLLYKEVVLRDPGKFEVKFEGDKKVKWKESYSN